MDFCSGSAAREALTRMSESGSKSELPGLRIVRAVVVFVSSVDVNGEKRHPADPAKPLNPSKAADRTMTKPEAHPYRSLVGPSSKSLNPKPIWLSEPLTRALNSGIRPLEESSQSIQQ